MLNTAPTRENIFNIIVEEVRNILEERDGNVPDITGADMFINGLEFSSLDLAHLLLELDARFEADPFESFVPITGVRSIDDMVDAYVRFFEREAVA